MDTKPHWLENLAVGDRVIVATYCDRDYVSTVARLTKTLIVLENGDRFRRLNGTSTGKGYHEPDLKEYSATAATALVAKRTARSNLSKVLSVRWRDVNAAKIAQVLAILNDYVPFPHAK